MSNYTKLTNFATKDSLASGNPLKVIKGTEIDDEFEALETAIETKADDSDLDLKANIADPTFTGTVTIPTAAITTGNITTLNIGLWSLAVSGTSLVFSYNGTGVAKIDSNGHITSANDVTGFGTI